MNYLTGEEALGHVQNALLRSYGAVKEKGTEAAAVVDISIDLKTVGDEVSCEAFSSYFQASKLPIRLYTEELKKPLSFSSNPVYSAVGDDLDGSYNFMYGMGMLPCGSILGIADKADPRFEDFIAAGILEFNSGHLFYAVRGEGAYVIENWANHGSETKKIRTSGRKSLDDPELEAIVDVYMLGDIAGFFMPPLLKKAGDFRSAAAHLAMVANGACDIYVLGDNCPKPNKRKTGEEIGPGYLLVKEAGGTMLDWNGNDIGKEKVDLHKQKTFHAVVAATEEIGKEFVDKIHKVPEIVSYMKRKGL